MRFRLSLQAIGSRKMPLNYQYEISCWLYKLFSEENPEFARELHGKGLDQYKRNFKYFTFSSLYPQNYSFRKDHLYLNVPEAFIDISFMLPQAVENFINAVFKSQKMSIITPTYSIDFQIGQVEALKDPLFTETMRFEAASPICLEKPVMWDHKLKAQYLHPDEEDYKDHLLENLLKKYQTLNDKSTPPSKLSFRLLNEPKSKLITIKMGKDEETRKRGYLYSFEISANKELLQIGYEIGFGQHNSQGFGCVISSKNQKRL